MLVHFGSPTKAADRRVAMGQGKLATIFHHHVVVKFITQIIKQLD